MPIVMVHKHGRNCPTIVCNACEEPVTEHGNVLWDPDRPDRLYYAHKGRCDRAIVAQCRPALLCWEELGHFLVFVANNAKLPPRALVNKEASIKRFSL
jgi:hypothetical protein